MDTSGAIASAFSLGFCFEMHSFHYCLCKVAHHSGTARSSKVLLCSLLTKVWLFFARSDDPPDHPCSLTSHRAHSGEPRLHGTWSNGLLIFACACDTEGCMMAARWA